jgi:hypothetical protein
MELDYILYDTAPFGVAGAADYVLFQVVENGDAVHVPQFTNMLGSGALPQAYTFRIESIQVFPAETITAADIVIAYAEGFISVIVGDSEVIQAPLRLFPPSANITGLLLQAVAADQDAVSMSGLPYTFDNPITIPGGTRFQVLVHQDAALGVATNVKVCLIGKLVKA